MEIGCGVLGLGSQGEIPEKPSISAKVVEQRGQEAQSIDH